MTWYNTHTMYSIPYTTHIEIDYIDVVAKSVTKNPN